MEIEKVNLRNKFEKIDEFWSPKIVGALNGQLVKLAKFKGEFVKHQHENEDELFYVVEGKIFIELENKTLEINEGELVIIPKGVEHKPYAIEEASVMMFEPTSTLNTGTITNEFTKSKLDWI